MIIVVEGLDRSGKSTQISKLKERLEYEKKKVLVFREPGSTEIGEIIRNEIIKKPNLDPNPLTQLFLFAAARAQLSGYLLTKFSYEDLYGPDIFILIDRWKASSFAYQGANLFSKSPYTFNRMLGFINDLNEYASFELKPNLSLFFELDLETIILRLKQEDGEDFLSGQKEKFYKRVQDLYRRYIFENDKRENFLLINANNKTIDHIHEQVYSMVIFEQQEIIKRRTIIEPESELKNGIDQLQS